MTDLLRGQIDFIYFVYGLGFILLLPICLYLHRRPWSSLPWIWLLLFGATHGLMEWLDMVALSLGTDPVFDVVRLGLLILSFLLLAEFGRAGLVRLRGRGPGRWILAVLLGLALLGAFAGLPCGRASARYVLGLVGALGAAAALWLAAHRAAQGRPALQGAALCMAGYAAAAGLVVHPAPFFPASWLNTEVFLAGVGVPIQLGRGFLAAGLSACLALFAVANLGIEKARGLRKSGRDLMGGTVVSVLVLVIAGWFVTQYLGREARRELISENKYHSKTIQAALQGKMIEADNLVRGMVGSPWILPALTTNNAQDLQKANAVLDRYSAVLPNSLCFLMDGHGLAIASSIRHRPDSQVGQSYSFRPYFQEAVQGTPGRYWAMGVTHKELGYFASTPVQDPSGKVVGVAVIKRTLDDVKALFPPQSLAFVIDSRGIVVLTNRPEMVYHSLWPLSPAVREELIASRQFGPGPFAPILAQAPVDGGDCRFQGLPYMVLRQPLPFQDWSIVILTSPRPIAVARMLGLSVTILSCIVVLSLLTVIGLTIESTSRVHQSENRFRQLYGNLRDGSAVVDMSGNIVECNWAFQAMLGYLPEELVKLSLRDITPETWREQEARIIAKQVLPWGYSDLYEQEYRRRDGSVLPVELQTYLVQEDGGQPTGMWVFVRDITERKLAEMALRESGEKYRLLVNQIPAVVFQGYGDWSVDFFDNKIETLSGYTKEEFDSRKIKWCDLILPEDLNNSHRTLIEALKTDKSYVREYRIRKKDGSISWIQAMGRIFCDAAGKVDHISGVFFDITERKRAEENLKQLRGQLELILNSMWEAIIELDLNGTITFANPAARQLLGFEIQEMMGQNAHLLFHSKKPNGSHHPEEECPIRTSIKAGTLLPATEDVFWRKDGTFVPVDYTCSPSLLEGRRMGGVLTFWDITQRKEAEDAFKSLVSHAPMGIYIAQDSKFVMINPGFEAITGYRAEELLGKETLLLVPPEDKGKVREKAIGMLKKEVLLPYEFQFITKSGETRWAMEAIASTQYKKKRATLGYFFDISERKSLEDQILQAQKMEAVGTLAGGIAHDFNNILTVILGNIYLSMMDKKIGPRVQDRLAQVEQACWRAQALSQQLLTFATGGAPVKKLFSVAELLTESTAFTCVGSSVRCETTFPENLWWIEADSGQIGQVFQNLTINAIQAMPTGGTIKVWAENLTLGTDSDLPLSAGRYIKISLRDQGTGIPAEHLPRIFDPFFTTKQKGSGLGLASAYTIIKKHHGHIAVESKQGVGTTFHIYLPAVERQATPQPEEDRGLLVGKGKILVMDDEEMVREVLGGMLPHLGYEAEFASNGGEAIEMFVQAHGFGPAFAGVILDLTVPGAMGGKETMARLLEIDPQVKAIVSSGYSDDPIMADFQKYGFSGVIAKPYKVSELGKILHDVIMGKP